MDIQIFKDNLYSTFLYRNDHPQQAIFHIKSVWSNDITIVVFCFCFFVYFNGLICEKQGGSGLLFSSLYIITNFTESIMYLLKRTEAFSNGTKTYNSKKKVINKIIPIFMSRVPSPFSLPSEGTRQYYWTALHLAIVLHNYSLKYEVFLLNSVQGCCPVTL